MSRRHNRRIDENFLVGSFLLRSDLRKHIHTLYHFTRTTDDIADSPSLSIQEKISRLDRIKEVLENGGGWDEPAADAMHQSLAQTGISSRHCLDLLEGFRLDAVKQRYQDWDDLLSYCRYSFMPAGRHILELHGEDSAATWPTSDSLTAALQVLDIVQDCKKDYLLLGRVYLPEAELAAFKCRIEDLRFSAASPGLRQTFDRLLGYASDLLKKAEGGCREIKNFSLRCEALALVNLAGRHLVALRKSDPLSVEIKLRRRDFALASAAGFWQALSAKYFKRLEKNIVG